MALLFELMTRFGVERVPALYVGGKEKGIYGRIEYLESTAGIKLWNEGMVLDECTVHGRNGYNRMHLNVDTLCYLCSQILAI